MKTSIRKIVSLLLCLSALGSCLFIAAGAEDYEPISRTDMLAVDGTKIYNAAGDEVVLRGTNFGGWGIMEDWFCPIVSPSGERDVYDTLVTRFGQEKADALLKTFRENWITEQDYKNVADLGMNVVRLPIWYRNFQSDDDGTWFRKADGSIDFSELDAAVEYARKYGLYLILDLHGLPGYQNDYDHCGKSKSMSFFDATPQGERYREVVLDFWTELARHFAGEPVIAMYDLMNEQLGVTLRDVSGLKQTMYDYTDALYDAIRAVDPDHVITVEAIWSINDMPSPEVYGWENVVYQLHFYDVWNVAYLNNMLKTINSGYNVPIYIGESYPRVISTFDYMISLYNYYGASWTTWTYKGIGKDADDSPWFLYGNSDLPSIDHENDSYEQIAEKWGECLRTDSGNFTATPFSGYIRNYVDGYVDKLAFYTLGALAHTGTIAERFSLLKARIGAMVTTVIDWVRKFRTGDLL